jgi:type II secretory pathway predicted ATPase ExeA
MSIEQLNSTEQLNQKEELSDSDRELLDSISYKYEPNRAIEDSIVRLEQEEKIYKNLEDNQPVLIRGNWRSGKTSMLKSLKNHKFGKENSIFIDASTIFSNSIDEFKSNFGKYQIIEFLSQHTKQNENEIAGEIFNSKKTPIEYLIQYLDKNKENNVFLGIDEVITLAQKNPQALEYIASLKNINQIKLAVVLHRFHSYEEKFQEIFNGFETHFLKPLSLDEVKKLITEPLKGSPVTFSDDAIEEILKFSGGRPYEINNLLNKIMSSYSEISKQKFSYIKEDIEEVANNYFELSAEMNNVVYNYEAIYLRSLSQQERGVIDTLVRDKQIPISNIERNVIQPLIDTSFVKEDKNKNIYTINGSFFETCLEKNLI